MTSTQDQQKIEIYPAHAGINRNGRVYARVIDDLPRTRGDKPSEAVMAMGEDASTPHTRG